MTVTSHNKNFIIKKCLKNEVVIEKKNFRKELIILEFILIKTKRPMKSIQNENFHIILQIS